MTPLPAPDPRTAALDRHALLVTIWLPVVLLAAALVHLGFGAGGAVALAGAFAAILAGFVGHLIVNAVTGTAFSPRELALGLVAYLVALLAFGLSALVEPAVWQGRYWTGVGGFVALFVAVMFFLVTSRGARGAFESFDVIRSFRAGRDGTGRSAP